MRVYEEVRLVVAVDDVLVLIDGYLVQWGCVAPMCEVGEYLFFFFFFY